MGVASKTHYTRIDPVTGAVASTAIASSPADALAAADLCAAAFATWSRTGPGERRRLLLRAADAMQARQDRFIAAMMAETGATAMWPGSTSISPPACCARRRR